LRDPMGLPTVDEDHLSTILDEFTTLDSPEGRTSEAARLLVHVHLAIGALRGLSLNQLLTINLGHVHSSTEKEVAGELPRAFASLAKLCHPDRIRKMRPTCVFVIAGPPRSGKSTYTGIASSYYLYLSPDTSHTYRFAHTDPFGPTHPADLRRQITDREFIALVSRIPHVPRELITPTLLWRIVLEEVGIFFDPTKYDAFTLSSRLPARTTVVDPAPLAILRDRNTELPLLQSDPLVRHLPEPLYPEAPLHAVDLPALVPLLVADYGVAISGTPQISYHEMVRWVPMTRGFLPSIQEIRARYTTFDRMRMLTTSDSREPAGIDMCQALEGALTEGQDASRREHLLYLRAMYNSLVDQLYTRAIHENYGVAMADMHKILDFQQFLQPATRMYPTFRS